MSNILNDCVIVNVDCSLWTGKARLTRDDLDPTLVAQLPPEALASMGSKALIDPALLKPIIAVKSRMFHYMDTHGVKFLGGWIISSGHVDAVTDNLQVLAQDYDAAVDAFLQDYDTHTQEWLAQFPQWANIIRPALPSEAKLRQKFGFHFQMYRIQPVEATDTAANNNLQDTISSLGATALQEIADMFRRIREETFKPDREKYGARAFRVFNDVFDKLRAVSFLNPSVEPLYQMLVDATNTYGRRTDDVNAMRAFGSLIEALADPHSIDRICAGYQPGNLDPVMSPFERALGLTTVAQPAQEEESEEELPVPPSLQQMSTLMARLAGVL